MGTPAKRSLSGEFLPSVPAASSCPLRLLLLGAAGCLSPRGGCLLRGLFPSAGLPPPGRIACLAGQGLAGGGTARFALQGPDTCARSAGRRLAPFLGGGEILSGFLAGRGGGTALCRRRQFHTRPASFRETDRNRLACRPGAVLSPPDILNLLPNKFSGLCRRGLARPRIAARTTKRFGLRHACESRWCDGGWLSEYARREVVAVGVRLHRTGAGSAQWQGTKESARSGGEAGARKLPMSAAAYCCLRRLTAARPRRPRPSSATVEPLSGTHGTSTEQASSFTSFKYASPCFSLTV